MLAIFVQAETSIDKNYINKSFFFFFLFLYANPKFICGPYHFVCVPQIYYYNA